MVANHSMKSNFTMSDGSTFRARYAMGRRLGNGGFGVVYAGTRVQDSLAVAIKIIPDFISTGRMDPYDKQLPLEVSILHRLSDIEGVVKLMDACIVGPNLYIVMEYVEGAMDLRQLMKTNGLPSYLIRNLFRQLVETVIQVQASGIVHRDIKPENVLVDPRTHSIRLIDFGCSSYMQKSYKIFRGTPKFQPPEFFNNRRVKSEAATVWSLGVTLFFLHTGRYPHSNWDTLTEQEWMDTYIPENIPWRCRDLILNILKFDDCERPTLTELLLHPYIVDVPIFPSVLSSLSLQYLKDSLLSFVSSFVSEGRI